MTIIKRIIAALAGALLILTATATGATAGGSGDFYKAIQCTAKTPQGATEDGAILRITNYDKGTGQEYHWSMTKSTALWPTSPYRFYFNGVLKDSAAPFEGYIYVSNKASTNTLMGKWYRSGDPFQSGCSRTL